MLIHHSGREYDVAASEAAKFAKEKMLTEIEQGQASAAATIEKVMTEVPEDGIVRARAMRFAASEHDIRLVVPNNGRGEMSLTLANNALQQLCGRADLPIAVHRRLTNADTVGWGPQLLAHMLGEIFSHESDEQRYLIRWYNGRARGVLSTSYRRLDSRPILDAGFQAANDVGLIPVRGIASETKVMIKFLLPLVFEPVSGEVICLGLSWENSDYGNGAHSLCIFILRLICTNYAIAEQAIRQIHLGQRISEDLIFSQKTYELDTQTTASAVSDIIRSSLGPDSVTRMMAAVRTAHESKISNPEEYINGMKSALTKAERSAVVETYNKPEVELLPAGNSVWRMSNAISLYAKSVTEPERRMELLKLAGRVLPVSETTS